MRIGIAMTFADGYSGGRLHAYLLGIELAAQGHDVSFVCNRTPGFLSLLPDLPGRDAARFVPLKFDALRPPGAMRVDLWIVVQERSLFGRFFSPVFENARRHGTPLLLLTFETPNWQSALMPGFRPGPLDALVGEAASLGAQVLSSTEEGRRWARAYFPQRPPDDFHVLGPPVLAGAYPGDARHEDGSIVAFVREASRHKGYDTVRRLLDRRLRGRKVVLVGGAASTYEASSYVGFKRDVDGLDVTLLSSVTEEEKYRLLKAARLVLFPSLFEGFGLPPGEAGYWGTPVVAYDLPVLREVYGASLRYVPAGDQDAFARAVHDELASEPDYTPTAEARRVGDPARWRADVKRVLDAVMARARPPVPLPVAGAARPAVIVVEQAGSWYKDDTAAAAGRRTDDCHVLRFARDVWSQQQANLHQRFVTGGQVLPHPGVAGEDLRGKLEAACARATEPFVFLAEDLVVCPAEVVQGACAALESSGAEAVAVPERIHFQEHGTRWYRAAGGELLASCGVFRRDVLLRCLRATSAPGARHQPGIDASFLVLAHGGRIAPAPGCADWLPPPSSPADAHVLPGGPGSWHAELRAQRGLESLDDPVPCTAPDDDGELARMLAFRAGVRRLLVEFEERRISREAVADLASRLHGADPVWAEGFDASHPYRTAHHLADAYFRYGRFFVSKRHMAVFVTAALAVLAPDPLPALDGPFDRSAADYLRGIREEYAIA